MMYNDYMKKLSLYIFLLLFAITLPVHSKLPCGEEINSKNSKIFIYHIPNIDNNTDDEAQTQDEPTPDIFSDDVTEDTSIEAQNDIKNEDETPSDEVEMAVLEDYELEDLYSDVLYGYAAYDEEEAISLENNLEEVHSIKIKKPAKVKTGKYYASKIVENNNNNMYSKLNSVEYSIAPISNYNYQSLGKGFSAGTTFNQFIDTAELEQSTSLFSRYETKYFALSTTYSKTVNSTNNNYNDNFYLTPELKLGQYLTIKEVFSTDVTKNRKKTELILSINPFGKKDTDRLRLEFGASTTFDESNTVLKNQLKFSTKIKL